MSIESHLLLRGWFDSLPEGNRTLAPVELINTDSPEDITVTQLLSGNNTITIPAKAKGCLILFDSRSTIVKKIKGVAGDTGITLHLTNWLVLSFTAGGMANFVLNASADDLYSASAIYTTIIFF